MNTNSNTYKNIDFNEIKNSYLINNKMKKHLNNALLYNSKNKTKKLNITPICKNVKKRLSPQPKDKIFFKKYFVNKKLSKDKYNMGNITCRNNSPSNYRIKEKKLIVKSCSSNCMESPKTINISRENTRKNILLNINTPNNANNQSYINPLKNLRPLATQRNKIAYIYKKKK